MMFVLWVSVFLVGLFASYITLKQAAYLVRVQGPINAIVLWSLIAIVIVDLELSAFWNMIGEVR